MRLYINFLFIIILLLSGNEIMGQTVVNDPIGGQQDLLITGTSGIIKYIDVDEDPVTGYKVFVWQEDPLGGSGVKDIYCSIYNVRSVLISQFVVNTTTAGEQIFPRVKVNKNDQSFIVVWASYINSTNPLDANLYDIYAKKIRFSSVNTDKQAPDLLVNSYTSGNQSSPIATFDYKNNEVVVGWVDQNGRDRLPTIVSGTDNGGYARRLNYSGTLSLVSGSTDFRINSNATVGHQLVTQLEISPVTGTLYSIGQYQNFIGGSGYDIVLGTFAKTSSGDFYPAIETFINTNVPGDQGAPSMAINSITGDIAISWHDNSSGNIGFNCYGKIMDKNGAIKKDAFKVAPYGTDNNELYPKVIWDEISGGLICFFWYSESGTTSVKYITYNSNFVKIQNEAVAVNRNLYNYYASTLRVSYDQSLRKAFVVYDEFNSSNSSISKGYFAQFKISEPAACNYIERQVLTKEVKDAEMLTGVPSKLANISRSYTDGMGRVVQTVGVQESPGRKDIVQPFEYDSYGRQVKRYLPYVQDYNGYFKADYQTGQSSFYNNNLNNNQDNVVNDLYPYSEVVYDNSVFNKISETSAPGASYKLGSGHTVSAYRGLNVQSDPVRKWTINASGNALSSSVYDNNTLYIDKSVDANGAISATYTDKLGNNVCTKSYPAGCTDGSCVLETYYVYDVFNNVRFIIPPQAVSELKTLNQSPWTVNYNGTSNVDKMVFCSKYDKLNRLVESKSPDKVIQYLVYNKLDQVILVQNGNQRLNNQWKFNKYDVWGRKIMSGQITDNRSIADIQTEIDSKPLTEKRDRMSSTGYTNVAFPVVPESSVLNIQYFDDYQVDFDNNPSTYHQYLALGLSPEPIPSINLKGKLTGSKCRDLQNMNWLYEVNFYDKKGRLIQRQSNNFQNPAAISYTGVVYDFSDRVLQSFKYLSIADLTIQNRYEYDQAGRLKNIFQKNNSDGEILLCQYRYNELGQLVEKNLHSEDGGLTFLQSVDYTYDIINSLTHINNSTLSNSLAGNGADNNNDANDLFGMELVFDKQLSDINNTPVFGGRASAMKWKVNNASTSTATKAYRYTYDNMARLSGSEFGSNNSGTFQFGSAYKEAGITYDLNGNIKSLQRFDQNGILMDQLSYDYSGTGNQLKSVSDLSANTNGFNDRSSLSSEYTYDPNGNIKSDANKGIAEIVYNHLNLPTTVYFGFSGSSTRIDFRYNSNGDLLSRSYVNNSNGSVSYLYIDGICFENGVVKYFTTTEGRAVVNSAGTGFDYQYHLQDHLGNVRVTFEKGVGNTARIIQEDNYYPFGLKHPQGSYQMANNGGANLYLFNGKELQNGLDVNNDLINDYDWDVYNYGARMYDPKIGRWNGLEPLAKKYANISPYAYALNSPVTVRDKAGMDPYFDYAVALAQNMAEIMAMSNALTNSMMMNMEANTIASIYAYDAIAWGEVQSSLMANDNAIRMSIASSAESFNSSYEYMQGQIAEADRTIQRLNEYQEKFAKELERGQIAEVMNGYGITDPSMQSEVFGRYETYRDFTYRDLYPTGAPKKIEWSKTYGVDFPGENDEFIKAGTILRRVTDPLVPVFDNLYFGAFDMVVGQEEAARQEFYGASDEIIEWSIGLFIEEGTIAAEIFEGVGHAGDATGFSITETIIDWWNK